MVLDRDYRFGVDDGRYSYWPNRAPFGHFERIPKKNVSP